jgi:uncharacterized protein DUF4383
MTGWMNRRSFALGTGVAYVVLGVLGFVPAVLTPPSGDAPLVTLTEAYGLFLGLFPVNIIHDLLHVGLGAWGLAAYRSAAAARTYARSLAVILAMLSIFGLVPGLETLFGMTPLYGYDVWLHALTAAVAAWFGWMERRPPAGTPEASECCP